MRRILVLFFGALVAAVLVAALALPAAVDWNAYKPEIAERLRHSLGRDVELAGDLSLSLLPRPELSARRIRIGPPKTGVAVDLAALESLRLRLAFLPLLRGRAHVEELVLVAPVVRLALPDASEPPEGPAPATAPAADSGDAIILDRLVVQDGTLLLRKGESSIAELAGVDGHLTSSGASGPFRAEGSFSWRGARAQLTAATGDMAAAAAPVSLVVRAADPAIEVKLSGQVERGGNGRRFRGKLAVSGSDLPAAARRFAAAPLPVAAAGSFAFDGQVTADARQLTVADASLRVADTQARGGAGVALDGSRSATLSLAMGSLDLDRWLAAPAVPNGQTAAPDAAPAPTRDFALPSGIDLAMDFAADAVVYRGAVLRQARIEGRLRPDGVLGIRRAAAQLPGASQVVLSGELRAADGRPFVDGAFEVAADNLRAALAWLGMDVAAVPADRLRLFAGAGKASGNLEELQLRDLDLSLDRSRISGAVTVRPGPRLAVGANLAIDSLDIDAYLTPTPPAPAPAAPAAAAKAAAPPAVGALLSGFDANVRTRIGALTVNEISLRDVAFDATLFNGDLTVHKAAFADAEGTSAQMAGAIAGFGRESLELRDIAYEVRSPTPERIFRLMGWRPPFAGDRLGSLAMTGRIGGGADGLAIEARAEIGGGVAAVIGRVDAPFSRPHWDLGIEASHASFIDLVRLFDPDYGPARGLGAFALSTRLSGGADELSLSDLRARIGQTSLAGEARLMLGDRPRVDVQLETSEIDLDAMLPARRDAALPADTSGVVPVALVPAAEAAPATAWSRAPLDLGWLQSVDGALTVNSRAVIWRDFRIDDAVLAAGLEGGVLTVHRLAGPMFDGDFELSAHLAANGAAGLDFRIAGAHLRNASIEIAGVQIEGGRLDAHARIETEGRSRFEMASRVRGSGAIDSRDGVIRGFNLGGVSQRLGNLRDIGDILGLLQTTMAGGNTPYSSLTGTFKAANGIASSDDLRLEAEGGTAQGVATVNLPAYTVDGRIVFRLTEHAKAPAFVMLVQGPLDRPRRSFDSKELQSWLIGKVGNKAGRMLEDALTGQDKGGLGKLLEGVRKGLGR